MIDFEEQLRDNVRKYMRHGFTFQGVCDSLNITHDQLRVAIRELWLWQNQ